MRGKESPRKKRFVEIAETTLDAIDRGSYIVQGVGEIYLSEAVARCVENTRLFTPDSVLSAWQSPPSSSSTSSLARAQLPATSTPSTPNSFNRDRAKDCKIIVLQTSTLAGARLLATTTSRSNSDSLEMERDDNKIGILNFASAKHPGGGFLNGAQAQEESIARSSTLYPSLMSETATPFYTVHRHDPQAGYYSHSMVYSPNVLLLRDDEGETTQFGSFIAS
jgi:hypothetical protein